MKLRTLIVDDEEIIRGGVRFRINCLLPYAEIVGEAQDADEAIEMVKTRHSNLVITDICMPETDGIEFIRKAKLIDENIKFVIISKIENDLAMEAKLKGEVRTSIDSLKNKYFTDLINPMNRFEVKQTVKKLEILDIRFTKPCFTMVNIMISCCDNSSEFLLDKDIPILKYSIKNISEEILASLGTVVAFESLKHDNQVIVLINHEWDNTSRTEHKLKELCRQVIHSMNKYFKVSVSIGIGSSFNAIESLPDAYMESNIAVLQRMILGSNRVIEFKEVPDSNRITFFLNDDYKRRLVNYIKDSNIKQCSDIIDKLFDQVEKEKLPYNNIKVLYIDLFLMLGKTVKDAGGHWDRVFKADIFSEEYLLQCISLDSLKELIKNHIAQICKYIGGLEKSQGKRVVDEIKEYIDNYYYSEVNLTDLANRYYLNPNYLGQLFKMESGENFVDYLTKKRIEKSVDLLLNTEFHTYKVAEMVGYVNSKYFCDVFKKVLGVTPSQFRQQKDSEVS